MSLYDVLGVSCHASQAEIRRAYIQRIRHAHPDKAAVATVASTRDAVMINKAYHVLGNPERRESYDASSGAWPDEFVIATRTLVVYTNSGVMTIEGGNSELERDLAMARACATLPTLFGAMDELERSVGGKIRVGYGELCCGYVASLLLKEGTVRENTGFHRQCCQSVERVHQRICVGYRDPVLLCRTHRSLHICAQDECYTSDASFVCALYAQWCVLEFCKRFGLQQSSNHVCCAACWEKGYVEVVPFVYACRRGWTPHVCTLRQCDFCIPVPADGTLKCPASNRQYEGKEESLDVWRQCEAAVLHHIDTKNEGEEEQQGGEWLSELLVQEEMERLAATKHAPDSPGHSVDVEDVYEFCGEEDRMVVEDSDYNTISGACGGHEVALEEEEEAQEDVILAEEQRDMFISKFLTSETAQRLGWH